MAKKLREYANKLEAHINGKKEKTSADRVTVSISGCFILLYDFYITSVPWAGARKHV